MIDIMTKRTGTTLLRGCFMIKHSNINRLTEGFLTY